MLNLDTTFADWLQTEPLTWNQETVPHPLGTTERFYAEHIDVGYFIQEEYVGKFSIYIYQTDGTYPLDRFVGAEFYMCLDSFERAKRLVYNMLFDLLKVRIVSNDLRKEFEGEKGHKE